MATRRVHEVRLRWLRTPEGSAQPPPSCQVDSCRDTFAARPYFWAHIAALSPLSCYPVRLPNSSGNLGIFTATSRRVVSGGTVRLFDVDRSWRKKDRPCLVDHLRFSDLILRKLAHAR